MNTVAPAVALYITTLVASVALPTTNSTVTLQARVDAPTALPAGGPQALEGYAVVSHDRGTTRLALGTIGNVQMDARGDTTEIRSLQAGGVITNDGHVSRWSGVFISQPSAGLGYAGPTHLDRYDYITFDNGWSLRPDGDRLLLCPPSGSCRAF